MPIGAREMDLELTELQRESSFVDTEEEEFELALGLISSQRVVVDHHEEHVEYFRHNRKDTSSSSSWKWWCFTITLLTIASVASTMLVTFVSSSVASDAPLILLNMNFTCPASEPRTPKNYDETFAEDYELPVQNMTHNATEFLLAAKAGKLDEGFDAWGESYDTIKTALYEWKEKQFAPYLEDGYTIYESACGHGLNLYTTLEIVNEVKGVENLVVYGNEYVPASAEMTDGIFEGIPPAKATKGRICTADSSNLVFVPSGLFDLVFTGYVSTLLDPLHFEAGYDGNKIMYGANCKRAKSHDWKASKLREIAQQRQEDWIALWVSEMVRIAKPGAPVIIEALAVPSCDHITEWGVRKDFWSKAIDKYGWDLDPASITFGDDFQNQNRYHVAMRKKGMGKF